MSYLNWDNKLIKWRGFVCFRLVFSLKTEPCVLSLFTYSHLYGDSYTRFPLADCFTWRWYALCYCGSTNKLSIHSKSRPAELKEDVHITNGSEVRSSVFHLGAITQRRKKNRRRSKHNTAKFVGMWCWGKANSS